MRYFAVVALLIAALPAYSAAQSDLQDVVYLTDGSIIRGTIIEHIPSELLRIQTSDGSVLVYSIDRVIKITREPVMLTRDIKRKEPGLACLLSILVAGGGQVYNEEYGKAALYFGVAVLNGVLFLSKIEEDWRGRAHIPEHKRSMAILNLVGWAAVYIAQIVDAPISANRINKKLVKPDTKDHPDFERRGRLGINPLHYGKGFGVTATLRF